jgi:hypothetical protein
MLAFAVSALRKKNQPDDRYSHPHCGETPFQVQCSLNREAFGLTSFRRKRRRKRGKAPESISNGLSRFLCPLLA